MTQHKVREREEEEEEEKEMEAPGEVNNYAILRQAPRYPLPDALRHLGLFFMLVASSFVIRNFGQSSASTENAFTIFSTFIFGLWMVMLSLVLNMFPLSVVRMVHEAMGAIHFFIFDLRVDLLF